jgi:hypothetical protein
MPPPPAPVRKEQNGGANDAVQSSLTAASVLEACSAELMKLEKVESPIMNKFLPCAA